jgi:hypothetical protein
LDENSPGTGLLAQGQKSHENEFEQMGNAEYGAAQGFGRKVIARSFVSFESLRAKIEGPGASRPGAGHLRGFEHLNIVLDRGAFRSKRVRHKWYDENWATDEPVVHQKVVVLDDEGHAIRDDPRLNAVRADDLIKG